MQPAPMQRALPKLLTTQSTYQQPHIVNHSELEPSRTTFQLCTKVMVPPSSPCDRPCTPGFPMAAALQVQRAVAMDTTGPGSSGQVPRIVTSLAGLGQGSSDDVPRPLPVRTRERKPSKKPTPQPEPEPEAMPSKRQRRAPSWLAEAVVDEVPQVISEQIQAKVDAMPGKPNKFGTTRFVNWKLLDKENMIVELEYSGKKYRGVLAKTGVSPTAGIVQENYEPPKTSVSAPSNKDMCALCNLPLAQTAYPGEAELQKVVAVKISSNWNASVHLTCGLWAPEVYEDVEGNLVNLSNAVRRGRALRCCVCKQRGAALGCMFPGCQRGYHLPCAHDNGCQLDDNTFQLFCPPHSRKRGY